jgi:tRNA(fMet)-specific endonuclease VapC
MISDFISFVPVVAFEHRADEVYAEIRSWLEARGTPIGPNDLFIAAHALSLDLTLVTGNLREFSRVPGLRVENWLD